jgi:hypothetical protein
LSLSYPNIFKVKVTRGLTEYNFNCSVNFNCGGLS